MSIVNRDELPVIPDQVTGGFIKTNEHSNELVNKFTNDKNTDELFKLSLEKISYINKKLKLEAVENWYIVDHTAIDTIRYRLSVLNFQLWNILNEINKI